MTRRDRLPNDVDALKDLVVQLDQRVDLLQQRCDVLLRQRYGQSSEKLKDPPGQQLLFGLPTEAEKPAPTAQPSSASKPHGGGSKPFPPELRRERIEYTLPEEQRQCSCCGEVMQPFGEDVTEQREFIPASLFVIQHARIKYAVSVKTGAYFQVASAEGE